MSDSINESGFIEWLREQFATADAQSMFRWVIVAWLVLVAVMVVMDRLGAGLLGRSRPLEQVPPERARTWRWGRRTPPPTYSLLPTGTVDEHFRQAPTVVESIPLSTRPIAALPAGDSGPASIANPDYWRAAADPAAPFFGYENIERLERGIAPERYNPITGRVESLDREEATGALIWPGDAEDPLVLSPDVAFDPPGDHADADETDGEAGEGDLTIDLATEPDPSDEADAADELDVATEAAADAGDEAEGSDDENLDDDEDDDELVHEADPDERADETDDEDDGPEDLTGAVEDELAEDDTDLTDDAEDADETSDDAEDADDDDDGDEDDLEASPERIEAGAE